MKKFTEKETRTFYNEDDKIYRSFWDKKGNLHWGLFSTKNISFSDAMIKLNEKMIALSKIDEESNVLDFGCGNGTNSLYIHQKTGANVTGIDLSDIRIKNARRSLTKNNRNKIHFLRSSGTKLKFKDEAFTHVWSQAAIYHMHDKKRALKEVHRVLENGGYFVFDDLIKPKKKVSKNAQKLVYERLLFDTDYNFKSYQKELEKVGFEVIYAKDLSKHLALSYQKLAEILEKKIRKGENQSFHEKYRKLIKAYKKMDRFVGGGDVGWALYLAKKRNT